MRTRVVVSQRAIRESKMRGGAREGTPKKCAGLLQRLDALHAPRHDRFSRLGTEELLNAATERLDTPMLRAHRGLSSIPSSPVRRARAPNPWTLRFQSPEPDDRADRVPRISKPRSSSKPSRAWTPGLSGRCWGCGIDFFAAQPQVIAQEVSLAKARSISDTEIALIRAMRKRGMRPTDIQFYFSRPDRPVNLGRIADIENDRYGPGIAAVADAILDAFIENFEQTTANAEDASPVSERTVKSLFKKRGKEWAVGAGETIDVECKEGFRLTPQDRFADCLRTICAFANNRGGYLLFGVRNAGCVVVGLADQTFAETDIGALNRTVSSALDPSPDFERTTIELDGRLVGVIYVAPHRERPMLATKSINKDFTEGSIYFRYPGESKAIRPGELRSIIADREKRAVIEFAQRSARAAAGDGAFLDLQSGRLEGGGASFLIDESLLPKLNFVKEGDFTQKSGSSAMRLVGDVRLVTGTEEVVERIVRESVTDEALLVDFLNRSKVAQPMSYVLHLLHAQRFWLPVFYYIEQTGLSHEEIAVKVGAEFTTKRTMKANLLERLRGNRSVPRPSVGPGVSAISTAIMKEAAKPPATPEELSRLCRGIIALAAPPPNFDDVSALLLRAYEVAQTIDDDNGASVSYVYQAACRLDELFFRESP